MKKLIAIFLFFCLGVSILYAQTAKINQVRVNQSMAQFDKMANLQFAPRTDGSFLTSFAGYESAVVGVDYVADWVYTVVITWNIHDKKTLGRMFLEIEKYLSDIYGKPQMDYDLYEDGRKYISRDSFPITTDNVKITLSLIELQEEPYLVIKYFVLQRQL